MEIQTIGYTILASEFEEQLIITATAGQSGHIALRVTRTGIDGGTCDWPKNNNGVNQICYYPYGKLKEGDAAEVLRKHLEKANVCFNIDRIMAEFKKQFLGE